MNQKVLLSTAYLAPIQYYSKLLSYKEVIIEIHDNFIKQTYRNRCKIYSANGELSLSIPVKKINPKTKLKDIIIDYDTNWQKLHWKSIESAYKSSPFFEYYADDLQPFYKKRYDLLVDFNSDIQKVILGLLEEKVNFIYTDNFLKEENCLCDDFRDKIHPKKIIHDNQFEIKEYNQVFNEKHGFITNLSIIDLIFNEGPNAINYLI